jgi:Uma2 family endonuclease
MKETTRLLEGFPMSTVLDPTTAGTIDTLADLLDRLGGIPLNRVRMRPAPGTATEDDVLSVRDHEDLLCELVDGVLVEKGMGFRSSLLALAIGAILREFAIPRNLGLVVGADGALKLMPGLVRIPDVSFLSWDRIPGGKVPSEAIPPIGPDLAVEVLSESNTKREMARKRREYFASGTRLVWEVDPESRTVSVYDAPERFQMLSETDTLDGGDLLPGFALRLTDLFGELDQARG